jgi:hypothetical protein
MARKLNERERRMLIVGAVAAVVIAGLHYGLKGLDHWEKVRASLKSARAELDGVAVDPVKQAALLSIVPVAEMPKLEEEQPFLFRDRLYEQLKKAGIKPEPLTILALRKKQGLPYDVMRVKCSGKCQLGQLMDFLVATPENPYLVGIEELRIRCDTKKPPEQRKDVEIDLVVSTFVRRPPLKSPQAGGQ